jgi:hypothetical protein
LVSLSKEEKLGGKYKSIDSLGMAHWQVLSVYLEGLAIPLLLCKQVFTNKDQSTWERYLICSDTTLYFDSITTIYKKRWKVEESFKSVKSNVWLAKSPTKNIRTQSNHFFASFYAYFKLQVLSAKTKINNFGLKSKLYVVALRASYAELAKLKDGVGYATVLA